MDARLHELAEFKYQQSEFLNTLFELAVEERWSMLQHLVQHDMAKAVIADYMSERGENYFSSPRFFDHWEEVIAIGWQTFCNHTGLSLEKVQQKLCALQDS
jgi:hypothetical protein